MLACSSAGGGLRIAVVGNEELVTAEAGRRVALSSGGKVVAVRSGGRDDGPAPTSAPSPTSCCSPAAPTAATPSRWRRAALAAARWRGPGRGRRQRGGADRGGRRARRAAAPYVLADNVVPRIGVLAPDSARAAHPRDVPRPRHRRQAPQLRTDERTAFTAMVRGATPDVVLTGVELLARGLGDGPAGGRRRRRRRRRRRDHRRAQRRRARPGGRRPRPRRGRHHPGHPHRRGRPRHALVGGHHGRGGRPRRPRRRGRAASCGSRLPARQRRGERRPTRPSPAAAVGLALKRHAGRSKVVVSPEGRVVERTGKDLREVDLLVGSGGVLRHGADGVVRRVLAPAPATRSRAGGSCPRDPRVVVDRDYVLAAAGLLAAEHPAAAHRLVRRLATGAGE